jgi:hypothetical protein
MGSFFFPLSATEYSPWYTRYLEIQPEISYAYQFYNSIAVANKSKRYPANNHFLQMSLSGAYDRWSLEFETNFAATRHRTFGFSDVRLTARYQWLDDILGDFASVVTGFTAIQDVKIAKNDISCFYHGLLEGELHLAIGKETSCEQFWTSRLWGVVGIGVADQGSPWLRGHLYWGHNGWDIHEMNIGLLSLWGLGGNNLNVYKPFRGYGSISHYSIDLNLNYRYAFSYGGILGANYSYRIYAYNCPCHVNTFEVNIIYPFGL